MLKRLVLLGLGLAVLQMSGCKTTKEVEALTQRVAKLEQDVKDIRKMLGGEAPEEQKQTAAYDVPVGNSPVLGNKDAKINITVFSNFQCPYCERADKMLRALLNDEELKTKVNIVFKNFPFDRHEFARPAAKAALAAGEQGKFWEMSERIFANQAVMSERDPQKKFDAKTFAVWAKELGLNVAQFEKDLKEKDKAYNEAIDRDVKLGAENAKLEGTPWILVGGWRLDDNIDAASIKKIIAEKKL